MVAAVLRGESFVGRALWSTTGISRYVPLRDEKGEVVGCLYVEFAGMSKKRFGRASVNRVVGKTGYVYVLQGTGEKRGCYVISYQGKRDGENIWEAKDADGRYFIQSIIQKALALKPGRLLLSVILGRTQANHGRG